MLDEKIARNVGKKIKGLSEFQIEDVRRIVESALWKNWSKVWRDWEIMDKERRLKIAGGWK